jgi:hypothetical protein
MSPLVLLRRSVCPFSIPRALQKTRGMAILRLFPTMITLTSSVIVTKLPCG